MWRVGVGATVGGLVSAFALAPAFVLVFPWYVTRDWLHAPVPVAAAALLAPVAWGGVGRWVGAPVRGAAAAALAGGFAAACTVAPALALSAVWMDAIDPLPWAIAPTSDPVAALTVGMRLGSRGVVATAALALLCGAVGGATVRPAGPEETGRTAL